MSAGQWATLALIAATLTGAVLLFAWQRNGGALYLPRWPRRQRAHPPPPTFAFVVPAGEDPAPPWQRTTARGYVLPVRTRHLRLIGPEGINPPGGAPGDALCGQALRGGNPEVPEEEFTFELPWYGEPVTEPCYHCDLARDAAIEDYRRQAGLPPPSPREVRAWVRYRRQEEKS